MTAGRRDSVAFGQAGTPGGDTVAKELSLDLGKGVAMKLVLIPAGKFKMGNHDTPAETVKKVGGGGRVRKKTRSTWQMSILSMR